MIKRLLVSAPGGEYIEQELPLGGFGISRYRADEALAAIARSHGVAVYESTTVKDIFFEKKLFRIHTTTGDFHARIACGTFGKRSNLDIKWKRPFTRDRPTKLNNYIGVKYHIRPAVDAPNNDFPADLISLHNFRDGYCGISRIEDDRYCLCYLTKANNLQVNGNSIPEMETNVLRQNPFSRKDIFFVRKAVG